MSFPEAEFRPWFLRNCGVCDFIKLSFPFSVLEHEEIIRCSYFTCTVYLAILFSRVYGCDLAHVIEKCYKYASLILNQYKIGSSDVT